MGAPHVANEKRSEADAWNSARESSGSRRLTESEEEPYSKPKCRKAVRTV